MTRLAGRKSVWGRVWRVVLWVVGLLLVAAGGSFGWLRGVTLPQVAGTAAGTGVSAPVTVTRDAWGVPHIRAQTDEDALFALGYAHWQDRSWQMEFQRRIVQGRLSEVLGQAALDKDKFLRTWGFQRAAEAALPALSARSRRLVKAYTAGVNAAMRSGKLGPEFRLLGFLPQPWTEVDSISWSKLMAYDLGGNMDDEVLGTRAVNRLGAAGLAEVLPPYPDGAPTILSAAELAQKTSGQAPSSPQGLALPPVTVRAIEAHLDAARSLGLERVPGKGSNDWVVAGSRTASGKPILADDPHLSLSSPMLWYLADVQGAELHAIGATIPGLPGVVIGRNDRVAWGVTNVNPDVQDLYVEPQGVALSTRTEVIKVKGGPDVTLTVRSSAHGPIVSDAGAADVGPRVALRWTALDAGDTTMDAFLGLNYARNWADFGGALRSYVAPSQNFVYADVDGNTGYFAPGRVPIRAQGDGSLPVPGDGAHECMPFIPFERLPQVYNPADGLVVTANNRPVPASYPYALGNIRNWAEPYRAERITQMLTAKPTGLTVDDVKRVQLDVHSLTWEALKPVLLAATPADDLSRRALELLRAWDGNETVDSVPASIYEAWLTELEGMATDELGSDYRLSSLAVLNQLRQGGKLCALDGQGDCARELTRTLSAAMATLKERLGDDPGKWQYGRLHHVASTHGALGGVKPLAALVNHRAPTPGGTNTVNVGRPQPGTFDQTHGPSYRQIIDLAAPNKSLYVGSLGQSGLPFTRHTADQMPLWIRGDYLPMSTDPADWGRTQVLTLR